MKTNHLTLKVFLLIVANDACTALAQLIMKKALTHTGIASVGLGNIGEFMARNTSSALLWVGILIYSLNFFIWIIVLFKIDLSIAMPVSSMSYIFVPIAAMLFLHEHVSLLRWCAVLCIMLGVYFVSQSKITVMGVERR
jgi:drug/metabolite transporter (DMT)-like permease